MHLKASRTISTFILILLLGTTACNLPSSQPATQDPYESAALTVTALAGTEQASQPSPTVTFTAAPPGTGYDKITSFAQGAFVTLVGHNADNSWWYVLTGNTNCWISASTGHTSGPLTNLPLIAAPPTSTALAGNGPKLSDPAALVAELSYPSNCTSNTVKVAIRVTDAGQGLNSVWLSYRYLGDGGYTGSWHTVSPNDNAAGGINGFNYAIGTEAAGELGTQNGTFQYQFFAKDNSNNTSSYPNGSILGMPIKYCP